MRGQGVVAVTRNIYEVRAKRWAGGWELHIDGVGVTQARTLRQADRMVRDYVAFMVGERQAETATFIVHAEVGGIEKRVAATKAASDRVARQQEKVAADYRKVAYELKERGLTGEDAARVMDLSPQRYSQLIKSAAVNAAKPKPKAKTARGRMSA